MGGMGMGMQQGTGMQQGMGMPPQQMGGMGMPGMMGQQQYPNQGQQQRW